MDFWEEEYKFIKKLSREKSDRFGVTSLLQHKLSGNKITLKTIQSNQEIGFQQLQNEATFSFDQPGLPKIIDSKIQSESISILKDYHAGTTIDVFWKTIRKKDRIKTLKRIIESLLPLFEKIKSEGIVHADIKPENIIVEERNGLPICSLIDFGLAFRRADLPERKTIFQLAYAPPEIILNQLDCADHSSDIFSMCLVIYKLWSNKLPFQSSNPALQTQLQITYPIEKPWRMPKKLWNVLEKGLKKHQFKTSPNRMKPTDIKEVLRKNNELRFNNFTAFSCAIQKL